MKHILFLKGGPGSGNYGHKGRDGKGGGSQPRHDPLTRLEQRQVRALYAYTIKMPLSDPDSMLVRLTGHDIAAVLSKGPAIASKRAGEIVVTGREVQRQFGTKRGYGMVKIIWRHGEKSAKAGTRLQVHKADILRLPLVVRQFPDEVHTHADGEPHHWVWRVQRERDGETVEYVVAKFGHGAASRHVVTIFVRDQAKKSLSVSAQAGLALSWILPARLKGSSRGRESDDSMLGDAFVFVQHDPLLKADTPPGARWITVHPNGRDAKGTPLLIQETKAGSGSYHVIGGAGGKLNYLRIHPSQDPAQAHREALERRKAKAETRKVQRAKEREAGTHKEKQAQREQVNSERRAKEREFIGHVAQAMGWQGHKFDAEAYPHLSDKALAAAARKHHREWLRKANEAINHHKQALLHDADARARALGHDPLEAGDKPLDLSDIGLKPTRKAQLGTRIDYTKEAEKRGASVEVIAREAEATTPEPDEAVRKRQDTGRQIAKELEEFRSGAEDAPADRGQPAPTLDTDTLLHLARAQKVAKEARKSAVAIQREIDADPAPKGAYHLAVSEVGMDEVRADLMNDLRTASTRTFLSEVGARGALDRSTGQDMTDGAHGAINALALAVSGSPLMDKSVVDTLGIAGAAQVLARKLKGQLSRDELDDLRAALGDYHADHYLTATEAALKEARSAEAAAKAIDIDEAATGADLETLKALNDRRAEAATRAQRILGRTLGEMEANAALVAAFGDGPAAERLNLPIGSLSRAEAITRARAIGLGPGDYTVRTVGGDQFLDIRPEGLDKLTGAVSRADLERYRESKAILTGERDEVGWMPQGIANRADLAMDELQPGVAPRLAEPFQPGPDLAQSIRDYIGGRTADGDAPADILADLHSQALADQSGDRDGYWKALDVTVPRTGPDGKLALADAHNDAFQGMADDFMRRRYGETRAPLHRQQVPVNDKTLDALHRTLAEIPEGAAAYKPIGDLTHQERRGLRQWFEAHVGSQDERGQELASELKAIEDREPPKTAPSLFGDDDPNPDHALWQRERDVKAAEVSQSGLSWGRYVEGMGGPEAAIQAVQDQVRGEVARRFAAHHNRLNPDAPLKVGRESIRGGLDHLDMVDPKARERRQKEQRDLVDSLRERDRGRYAAGSVADRLSAVASARAAESQAQIDLFGFSQSDAAPADTPLHGDQRHTLGHAAERQIAGLMQHVGANFRPGDRVKIWRPSMDGDKILGQRAIKFIEANKRVALGLGVGTGKTLVSLGAFTDLHAQGKAKKGLFVVPSSVQGQFHGEALRYLDPTKGYKWHAQPGASREERLAAMRDPGTHFVVTTHQALRNDLLHLGAMAEGIEPGAMAERLDAMNPAGRKEWAGKVMAAHGIKPDFVMTDEAHGALNRKGKENSALANVLDAVGHNADYHVLASADPVKNDASEIHSLLEKLDPERYGDRDAFLRRYGGDTIAKKDALRREMTPYLMTGRTEPPVKVTRREESVALNAKQQAGIKAIDRQVAAVRLGRIKGKPDLETLKELSPGAFAGAQESDHPAIAERLQQSLGVIKDAAMRRVIDDRGQSAKLDAAARIVAERKGKPGVIFAHSLDVAKDLHERLTREGHRVGLLTGAQTAKDRDKIRQGFNPESGDPEHDILVMSDAGAVGINAQRGQWLMQYDSPPTAMVHAQRQGRIHRLGQKNDVELIDLVGDHPHEHGARERLRAKYALREVMTDPAAGLDDSGLAAYLGRRQAERETQQGGLF